MRVANTQCSAVQCRADAPRLLDIFVPSTVQCACTSSRAGGGNPAPIRNAGQKIAWNLPEIERAFPEIKQVLKKGRCRTGESDALM